MPIECDLNGWWPPGCGLVSQANDGVQGSITSIFANVLQNIASWMWGFITGAFSVSEVDDSQWAAIGGLTNWWVIVMMTPLVVVMILQLLSGLISQQPRRLIRALVGGAAAVPLVAAAVYLVQQLTRVTDSASTALLESIGTDPYVVFMRLFGFERAPAGSEREWNVISLAPGNQGGAVGGAIVTVMAVIVVWILAFILMCSMIFRTFALAVLAAVAPVALMMMPWEKSKAWAGRWCEVVVALLLAKPLAATVLATAIKLFADSTSFAGLAAGTVGMVLACGAPLMALRLVSFAGGELAAAAQTAGGGHVLARSSSVVSRQFSRQLGGMTIASMLGRSSLARPIPSSRKDIPPRLLAPSVPLPRSLTGTTPVPASGANPSAANGAGSARGGAARQDDVVSGEVVAEPSSKSSPATPSQTDRTPTVGPAKANRARTPRQHEVRGPGSALPASQLPPVRPKASEGHFPPEKPHD
ncbi:type IV secretion system protein [Paenarthrobacter ureafaciens]|uniref:type IV secretion system protein n=1 Tax=Paenarthrobacter ureafaciens TaxID=37931 RepID=UPI002DBE3671|nr:type IV secretion system protein [Paenarthrobacter ureafaciens]MEC3854275.1 type IV secretion system protein [Paenarthrobacter ureafaciens]